MPTTIVYPSIDVSGTGSISTIISTAGTFAGSLTASTFAVTGTATFSGTAVFMTTAQFLGTVTFSSTVRALGGLDVSGTLSAGQAIIIQRTNAIGLGLAGSSTGATNVGILAWAGSGSTPTAVTHSNRTGGQFVPSIQVADAGTGASFGNSRFTADTAGARYTLGKARGTAINDFTVVNSGDTVGELLFNGGDGTDFATAASIRVEVDGTPGNNDMPGRIVFATTADGINTTTDQLTIFQAGTASFTGIVLMGAQAGVSGTLSAGVLVGGSLSISAAAVISGQLTVAGSSTFSGTAVFVTTPLVNRGTGFYAPNSYLLATASGATTTQFKLAFSNTNGAFTQFRLCAQGKASGGTNFIVFFYSDGGTTPFMTYALAANTTATASSGILLMDVVHDVVAGSLMVAQPVFQHFKGVTTQATQTRSTTFTTSCINCIGVTMGAATTTKTMSAASIYLTGIIGNK